MQYPPGAQMLTELFCRISLPYLFGVVFITFSISVITEALGLLLKLENLTLLLSLLVNGYETEN